MTGLEPAFPCENNDLNVARLPNFATRTCIKFLRGADRIRTCGSVTFGRLASDCLKPLEPQLQGPLYMRP